MDFSKRISSGSNRKYQKLPKGHGFLKQNIQKLQKDMYFLRKISKVSKGCGCFKENIQKFSKIVDLKLSIQRLQKNMDF